MAIKKHLKLVRDKIPEIIVTSGVQVGVEILDDTRFSIALRQKLVEEAREAQQAKELICAGQSASYHPLLSRLSICLLACQLMTLQLALSRSS